VRCFLKICLILVLVLLVLGLVAGVLVRRATKQVPEFYAAALEVEVLPLVQQELSDDLERDALELHNEVQQKGVWEATFTDAELNAWAATVLPEEFPDALPAGIREPRVRFTPETVQIACQFQDDSLHLDTVLSVEAQVYLTDQPNEIAIQIGSVRAGVMPLPRKALVDRAIREARQAGVHLQRTQQDDDPVLLVRFATQPDPKQAVEVIVQTLAIRDGEVYLAGETGPVESGS